MDFKGFFQHLPGRHQVLGRMDRHPGGESGPFQHGHDLRHPDRVAFVVEIPAVGAGGGGLPQHGGGGHLAPGHAVNGIVDEDDGDPLSPVGTVQAFGNADRGQVAVALIGEYEIIRAGPFDAGGHRRGPAMGGFTDVHVKIIIHEDRAADRGGADGLFPEVVGIDTFRHQAVDDPVMAAGAEMERDVD